MERKLAEFKRFIECNKWYLLSAVAVLALAMAATVDAGPVRSNDSDWLGGTRASSLPSDGFIVRPEMGVDLESLGLEAVGETVYHSEEYLPENLRFAVVRSKEDILTEGMLSEASLEALSGVENVEINGYLSLAGRYPVDPFFGGIGDPGRMWGWQALEWNRAYPARPTTNISLGTIDTGCPENYSFQEDWPYIPWQDRFYIRDGEIIAGYATDLEYEGHGTHVGGIMWALADNGQGMAGLLSQSGRKVCIKAFHGNSATYEDVALAFIKARLEGVQLINGSFGGPNSDLAQDALDFYLGAGNTWAVFACGNVGGAECTFPGNLVQQPGYERVFSAMALQPGLTPASYSSQGGSYWMPGSDIWSTTPLGYESKSGTSMASPHLAAMIAIVLGQHPEFDGQAMKTYLDSCSIVLPNGGLMPNWSCVGEDSSVWTSVYLPVVQSGERAPTPTPWPTPTLQPPETWTPGGFTSTPPTPVLPTPTLAPPGTSTPVPSELPTSTIVP